MNQKKESLPYKIEDAMKITDEIFKLSKEKEYNVGAFVHGLIFALEYAQFSYKIPQQQIAVIKRDCRRYFKEMDNIKK
ncbi:MAG: hypothetical protein JSW06_10695 [Thermoplasmatales archaeon]|nr:MAG: hypothetical protein JSW06_10695 [Thermoplasmatales archaeon]